ncbi:DUF305 domain-containing protein [Sinorhizobium meliloti]|uniref:CopM family metallochaperone n=1 Tax=Rhizobium meliloti TaxID=382 RepID=UPI000B4A2A30|nr:DUF305 domain-containing protein [Sinorhizobium meliloti]MDX0986072.1 DUF305 domain-containing protein [Sinorhizobium medicae]ASQ14977.1 DUF305 domain-containing protein [Sinorhizobium meliloti]MDX1066752.1 DUF305 domain-containing protein [Sinorhizobium medicae]MQU66861.1 DUF305 domain-containing protein [Sinorhizobium meliloti]MQU82665.1 DUF305 domain-containing protein [Sinorhizobium meliloti]
MKAFTKFAIAAAAVPVMLLSTTTMATAQMAVPDACKTQTSAAGDTKMMPDMQTGQMAEHQKAMMDGMQKTQPAMMQGVMAQDPDVSFVCGMIAHHMGAISMSEVELKYGDDQQAKSMAQKIIDAQKKEIEEMTAWVTEHAK